MDSDMIMTISVVVAVVMFVLRQLFDMKGYLATRNGKDPVLIAQNALDRIEERVMRTLEGQDVRIRAAENYISSHEAKIQAFWREQWRRNERIESRVDQLEGICIPKRVGRHES